MTILSGAVGCGGDESHAVPITHAKHMILITVDTYRFDHFLTDRAGIPLTPRLLELAEDSQCFSQASSCSCCTSPGVTSILTGMHPLRSGVIYNTGILAEVLITMAEILKAGEFRTGAFVGNPVLKAEYGFAQGFDSYDLVVQGNKGRADKLTERALQWLRKQQGEERLFLWVHYMDPHGPYNPPESFLSLFPKDRFPAGPELNLQPQDKNSGQGGVPAYQQTALSPPSRDAREYLARYAAEVRFLDDEIGRLIRGIKDLKLYDQSVILLTADHGEALADDHGFYFSHGNGLTQDQIHVPLLLRYPGCTPGSRVDVPVSTADVLPTVLELLGCPNSSMSAGISLLDLNPRTVVSQFGGLTAIRVGPWKMICQNDGKNIRLYDLAEDPEETADLADSHKNVLRNLGEKFRKVMRQPLVAEPRNRNKSSEEAEKQLHALGY